MRAKREFRDRRDVEVAVLDALVDRGEEGMTVFEVRAAVDVDIDTLEEVLSELKADSLIRVESDGGGVTLYAADRVIPDPEESPDDDRSIFDAVRDRFGF